jgi:hypothetical protein
MLKLFAQVVLRSLALICHLKQIFSSLDGRRQRPKHRNMEGVSGRNIFLPISPSLGYVRVNESADQSQKMDD